MIHPFERTTLETLISSSLPVRYPLPPARRPIVKPVLPVPVLAAPPLFAADEPLMYSATLFELAVYVPTT